MTLFSRTHLSIFGLVDGYRGNVCRQERSHFSLAHSPEALPRVSSNRACFVASNLSILSGKRRYPQAPQILFSHKEPPAELEGLLKSGQTEESWLNNMC